MPAARPGEQAHPGEKATDKVGHVIGSVHSSLMTAPPDGSTRRGGFLHCLRGLPQSTAVARSTAEF